MINLVKIISTEIDGIGRRLVKVLRLGKSDVKTPYQISSWGVDACPPKDTIAIYAESSTNGNTVIIGYINKNALAKVGEHRIFSTDENGNLKFAVHLKNDGTCEVGGDADNMVRFSKLEEAFNEFKQDVNTHIQNWNTFALAYTPGSPSTLGTPPTAQQSQQTNADISPAKIDEIKTL